LLQHYYSMRKKIKEKLKLKDPKSEIYFANVRYLRESDSLLENYENMLP